MLVVAKPQEQAWTPVMGAQVLFAPITRAMLRRARRAALAALGQAEEEGAAMGTAAEQMEELGDALSLALLMEGTLDWRDVCRMADDEDEGAGEALAFTAENLSLALSDPLTFEAFDNAYVVPYVTRERERAAPGNGSSPSQDGTGPAGTEGATIVTSPALPAQGDGVASARTPRTPRKPTKKKMSGAS